MLTRDVFVGTPWLFRFRCCFFRWWFVVSAHRPVTMPAQNSFEIIFAWYGNWRVGEHILNGALCFISIQNKCSFVGRNRIAFCVVRVPRTKFIIHWIYLSFNWFRISSLWPLFIRLPRWLGSLHFKWVFVPSSCLRHNAQKTVSSFFSLVFFSAFFLCRLFCLWCYLFKKKHRL